MLTRQEYLQNPCRASALPYWKLCAGNLPEGVEVIHEKEAGKRIGDVSTAVECYFRLFHHLDTLSIDSHSEIVLQTAWKEVNVFAEIINASYPDLRVSEAQLLQLQAQACFSPEGWVVALDRQSGKPLACGIAALDRQKFSHAAVVQHEGQGTLRHSQRQGGWPLLPRAVLSKMWFYR